MKNSVTKPETSPAILPPAKAPAASRKPRATSPDAAAIDPHPAQPQIAAAALEVARPGSARSPAPAESLSVEKLGHKTKSEKPEIRVAATEPAAAASPSMKSKLEKILPHTLPAAAEIPAEAVMPAVQPGFAAPQQAVLMDDHADAAPVEAEAAPPAPERRINVNDRNPPRIPSKAENFAAGDHVVYPTHGVGKVEKIAVEEIAGHSLELIHITFEENRMTLRVPVSKARSAGLRKLASRKMFDEALAVLKGRARIKRTMWSRRAQEYEAKINSGDPLSIAEVVRDLHRNAGQPDQSFSERQIYEAAMDRLAAELGALDNTDKVTAVAKLAGFLKTVA